MACFSTFYEVVIHGRLVEMDSLTLLGIYREPIFSPGKVRQDAAILDATLRALSLRGYLVHSASAKALNDLFPRPPYALSMAQSDRALRILEKWQRQGTCVINAVRSIRNCRRKRLLHLLAKAHLPIPPSQVVPTDKVEHVIFSGFTIPCWLKRGDVHAVEKGDVVKVTSTEELKAALDHFDRKNIAEVLVQGHVEGEVIKFYGVGKGAYFSAFSLSGGNEASQEVRPLYRIAYRAAAVAGLEIYGGDAILTPEGKMVLIDLNDWPSFSRCCLPAAAGIAQYITRIWNGGLYG